MGEPERAKMAAKPPIFASENKIRDGSPFQCNVATIPTKNGTGSFWRPGLKEPSDFMRLKSKLKFIIECE